MRWAIVTRAFAPVRSHQRSTARDASVRGPERPGVSGIARCASSTISGKASGSLPSVRMRLWGGVRIAAATTAPARRTIVKYGGSGPKVRPPLMPVISPSTRLFSASRAPRNSAAHPSNRETSGRRSRIRSATRGMLGGDRLRLTGLVRHGLALRDRELALDGVDLHRVARGERREEQHLRQGIGDLVLDRASERPGAEVRVVADGGDVIHRLLGHDEGHLLRCELLADALELERHDLPDLGLRERLEDDGRVDPVQELRPEEALHLVVHALLHVLVGRGGLWVVALAFRSEPEPA